MLFRSRINIRGCEDDENKNDKSTFARMESDCTWIFGFNALIKGISYTKQSNFFLHFFEALSFETL